MGLQQPDHQRPFGLSGRKTVALVDRLRTGPVQRTRTDRGQIPRPADDALLRRRGTHRLRGAALLHGILAQRQHRPAGAHFHPVGLLPFLPAEKHVRTRDELEPLDFDQVPYGRGHDVQTGLRHHRQGSAGRRTAILPAGAPELQPAETQPSRPDDFYRLVSPTKDSMRPCRPSRRTGPAP